MSVHPFQSNLPLVESSGKMTQVTEETLQRLVREVQALREIVTDFESRITALEP